MDGAGRKIVLFQLFLYNTIFTKLRASAISAGGLPVEAQKE